MGSTQQKNDLKPCPFCEGKAKRKSARYNLRGAYGTKETEKHWYGVYCTKCKISQPIRVYETREASDEAWNNRVN